MEQKKPIYKKWWFWLIVAIIVIGMASSGENNSDTKITSQGESINNDQIEQQTQKKVNVGETVQTNEVKISYKSSQEYTNYNTYSKPKNGNKIMRVEFEFENVSNGDIYLDSFECYADGEKCEEYYYADDYKNPTLESLSSNKKIKAVLYYEVPTSAQEIILEYETDYWSNEKVEFIVK